MILNRVGLSLRIQMWRYTADHFDRAYTMRDGHDRVTVDPFARGPFTPFTIHRARRINKYSV